jgi:uncharacterized glyoxalase superfamily protein PhnB
MPAKPIPEGFHTITPYLLVPGATKLMDFLKQAFDAKEDHVTRMPDGRIMHADLLVGTSHVMMGEPPLEFAPMPAAFYVYVSDVDATYQRAIRAGGEKMTEPKDEFYGDRVGGLKDPCGNIWWIATHKEDVSPDELARRAQAAMKQRQQNK